MNQVDKRKLFVKVIFTAELIKPKKAWNYADDSEWSPHKVHRNELI